MKMKLFVTISILCIVLASYLIGTGFQKMTTVVLTDYTVSEDGTRISFDIEVASSMGYVRGFKDNGGGVKPHYLTFYQTYGGLNSSFGAKNTFILEIAQDDTEIYFNRSNGGNELVLKKDTHTGKWIRASK